MPKGWMVTIDGKYKQHFYLMEPEQNDEIDRPHYDNHEVLLICDDLEYYQWLPTPISNIPKLIRSIFTGREGIRPRINVTRD